MDQDQGLDRELDHGESQDGRVVGDRDLRAGRARRRYVGLAVIRVLARVGGWLVCHVADRTGTRKGRTTVQDVARQMRGIPYQWPRDQGLDCSALVHTFLPDPEDDVVDGARWYPGPASREGL
jgi:hypothetical protein